MEEQLARLEVGQERLSGEIAVLRATQTANHTQNRGDIHKLRGGQQSLGDKLHLIDIKLAKAVSYATGAGAIIGAIVAFAAHFIDKIK